MSQKKYMRTTPLNIYNRPYVLLSYCYTHKLLIYKKITVIFIAITDILITLLFQKIIISLK